MKRILLTCFMLVSFLCNTVWAQDRTVSGKVTSAEDGSPLPGVNVVLKGTGNGTTTDIDGNYKLSVPSDGGTLAFSFIGMKTLEEQIGARSVIDVQMTSDVKQLQEVVVSALGIKRDERSVGYASQSVNGDDLNQARQSDVVKSLSGKVAGVSISGGSSQGGSSRILIRGANSIAGNNQPLFVVDGIPLDNSNYTSANQARGGGGYDYGNMAQDINPDDIESITVLKGASAAALYGTRASNGVIVITTKKGAKGKGIGVSVNSSVTFDDILVLPNYQNQYGGGYSDVFDQNKAGEFIPYYGADESWGPRLDGTPVRQWYSWYEGDPDFGKSTPWVAHPDNIKNFFNTGVTWNNNISLSGGNDVADYRLSYTNFDQSFITPNGSLKKNTVSFNGSLNLTDKLTSSIAMNYVNTQGHGRPDTGYGGYNPLASFNQWFERQVDMSKLKDYKVNETTQRTWNIRGPGNAVPAYWNNPYWNLYKNYEEDSRDRLYGKVELSYKLTDNLKAVGRVMNDFYNDRRSTRIAVGSLETPEYYEAIRRFNEMNADFRIQFDKVWESFSLNAFVGTNRLDRHYNLNDARTNGGLAVAGLYTTENSIGRPTIADNQSRKVINSVYGSASLGYNDMLYLDVTGRNDWSSTLPAGNNSYFYPSVTGSFVFSELIDADFLSFGKLRAGWAKVGNDTDPYQTGLTYSSGYDYERGQTNGNFGSTPLYTVPNARNNPDLKPEQTESWEVGTQLSFFKRRVGLDLTYYNSVSTDQIFTVPISGATGYTSTVINAGKMTNDGIEALLNLTPVKVGDFRWDMNINWAKNNNKVVKLTDAINTYRLASLFGGAVVAQEGERYGTLLGADFVYDANGNKITEDGAYKTTGEDQVIGSVLPDWTGGIRNTFSWKGLSASVLIDGQKGGDIFSVTNMFGTYTGIFDISVNDGIRETGMVFDGVKADGSPNDVVVDAQNGLKSLYRLHKAFTYDATYAKLREVSVGYTLPNSIMGNLPFKNVTLSVIGRNLAILKTNVPNIDPENTNSAGNIQGIEGATAPTTKSWGFNLSFKL